MRDAMDQHGVDLEGGGGSGNWFRRGVPDRLDDGAPSAVAAASSITDGFSRVPARRSTTADVLTICPSRSTLADMIARLAELSRPQRIESRDVEPLPERPGL
jgi:hypothetical protein